MVIELANVDTVYQVQGFVQRVIAKEKEVRQLQAELDRLRGQLPTAAVRS